MTAEGGDAEKSGAGGAGIASSYGEVIISGGSVSADGGIAGSFSTGDEGSAVIFADSIEDGGGSGEWHGVIFTGGEGRVYGERVETADFSVPEGMKLTVPAGSRLVVGRLSVDGELSELGEIDGEVVFGTVQNPFDDVDEGDWFYDEVLYAYANGLMTGESASVFNPDGKLTRAMVWAILARMDGEEISGAGWDGDAREWAVESGVSDGSNAGGSITREEFATMLYRYSGEPEPSGSLEGYSDAGEISSWAGDAMTWAVSEGIISGSTATTVNPSGSATRAEAATMLMRYAEG